LGSDLSKRNHKPVFVQNNYVLSNFLHKKFFCRAHVAAELAELAGKMLNQGGAGEKAGGGGAKDEGGEKQEKAAQQPCLGHYQV
jgi:hypothetical protein